MPALNIHQSITSLSDTLWVLGGSDGASSLRTTEMYDPNTKVWTAGPLLNMQRANVSAVSLKGNLYAIGGFSGKKFLNTLEVLAEDSQEWCCYQPARKNGKKRIGSADSSGQLCFILLGLTEGRRVASCGVMSVF